MGSLDVDSLFTNMLLKETIDILTNTFFENIEKVEGLSKIEFKEFKKESNFCLLLEKNPILFLMESSTGK